MKLVKVDIYSHNRGQIRTHRLQKKIEITINKDLVRKSHIKIIRQNISIRSILCIGSRHDSEILSFIDAGYNCKGIDISTNTEHIINMDAHKMSFDENEFDMIYASHSLEHMHDPRKVLKDIRRISKHGLFVVFPVTSEHKKSHPVIFDIMSNPIVKYNGDPDFDSLDPYNILHYEIVDPLAGEGGFGEILILFRFL